MRTLIRDIKSFNNLEKNMPLYVEGCALEAKLYAVSRLGLNKINIKEYADSIIIGEKSKDLLGKYLEILNSYLNDDNKDYDSYIDSLNRIRESNKEIVSDNTNYTLNLMIYQHMLNRVEGRFKSLPCIDENMSDEKIADEITDKIIKAGKDGLANILISRIISELPVRLTMDKFSEYVKTGLSVYAKSDNNTIKDYVSMLRYNALLGTLKSDDNFKVLNEKIEVFDNTDYKNITEEEFNKLNDEINNLSEEVDNMVTYHIILQQLINDLYVCILADKLMEIASSVSVDFTDDERIELIDRLIEAIDDDDAFAVIVPGVQEEHYENIDAMLSVYTDMVLEKAFDKIEGKEGLSGITSNKDKITDILSIYSKLLSNSDFTELERTDEIIIEDGYFEKERDKVVEDICSNLKEMKKAKKRAVMANVLGNLPVFFGNINELKEYIVLSLSTCNDKAEKDGCISLITQILSEY